jgi:F-box/leucine-rich repeat protein 2/20
MDPPAKPNYAHLGKMRAPNGGFQGGVRIVTTVPPSLGELRQILSKLENDKDKEIFGLVSKRWLRLQSTERKKLAARAGPHMLQKMAARFSRLIELDFV